jgi:hypothetical protein
MTMPAGLPQPRPDQQYQASGAAMAPGSQTPVVRAREVIIFGPAGVVVGLFVYATGTTPAAGNPPVDSITRSATDPFGNAVEPDFTAYGPSGSYAQLTDGELNFVGSSGQPSPAQIRTENIAGLLDLISGEAVPGEQQAEITLQSASVSGSGKSTIDLSGEAITGLLNVPNTDPGTVLAAPASYTQTWGNNIVTILNQIIAKGGQIGLWP